MKVVARMKGTRIPGREKQQLGQTQYSKTLHIAKYEIYLELQESIVFNSSPEQKEILHTYIQSY